MWVNNIKRIDISKVKWGFSFKFAGFEIYALNKL